MNNSSLVGLGYTQTLKPGEWCSLLGVKCFKWAKTDHVFKEHRIKGGLNRKECVTYKLYKECISSEDKQPFLVCARLIPMSGVSAGIKLTLSALLDGKNINAGGHKLGLGLEFQA